MNIRSFGCRTDFIFARFSGSVEDKGSYTTIKTPSHPTYHWGNYIVFNRAPKAGDLQQWKALFDKEYPYYSKPHHYVFAWDTENEEKGQYQEFLDDGFEFDSAVVLTAKKLQDPPHPNKDLIVRKIESDEDWEKVIQLQSLCSDPKYFEDEKTSYDFSKIQMGQFRKMSEAAKGNWFGAFSDDRLVGDLGIFFEGELGRYQSVGTHPEFRRQGVCATLVYEAGKIAFDEFGVETLVMEADPDYHAARVYESVGFVRSEQNHALSWWQGNVIEKVRSLL